jgi:hypothetical protein
MKWPWISRTQAEADLHYAHFERDTLAALREQDAASARREREMAAERYDALLEKFTALRIQGATPEPKPQEWDGLVAPAPKPDPMRDLIHERFGSDPRRLRMALAQLKVDRAAGVDADTIENAILNGYSPEGVPQ